MLSGWSRAIALIAAAALLANGQCYGTCGAAACKSPQAPAKSCHHHKSSPEDQGCRHPEFAGPEPAVANMTVMGTVSPAVVATASSVAAMETVLPFEAHDGSPPGSHVRSTISILRI